MDTITFDLETTGVSITKDRIVQFACTKKDENGVEISTANVLINPEMPIPKEASDVHGITDDMVADKKKFNEIAQKLHDYIKGCYIIGFNHKKFDIPFIVEEFLRAGVEVTCFPEELVLDVSDLYRKLNPRTLVACYKQYTGLDLDGAHDALNDVNATDKVLEEMVKSHDELKDLSFDQLRDFAKLDNKDGLRNADYAGKIKINEKGEYVFGFGKNMGKNVNTDRGYLTWMLDNDFSQDTKNWCRKLLK